MYRRDGADGQEPDPRPALDPRGRHHAGARAGRGRRALRDRREQRARRAGAAARRGAGRARRARALPPRRAGARRSTAASRRGAASASALRSWDDGWLGVHAPASRRARAERQLRRREPRAALPRLRASSRPGSRCAPTTCAAASPRCATELQRARPRGGRAGVRARAARPGERRARARPLGRDGALRAATASPSPTRRRASSASQVALRGAGAWSSRSCSAGA